MLDKLVFTSVVDIITSQASWASKRPQTIAQYVPIKASKERNKYRRTDDCNEGCLLLLWSLVALRCMGTCTVGGTVYNNQRVFVPMFVVIRPVIIMKAFCPRENTRRLLESSSV